MATFLMILAAFAAGAYVMRWYMRAWLALQARQHLADVQRLIDHERAEARRWGHLDD